MQLCAFCHQSASFAKTFLSELVGWELSMKNELIIARRHGVPRGNARERLQVMLRELNLEELKPRFAY